MLWIVVAKMKFPLMVSTFLWCMTAKFGLAQICDGLLAPDCVCYDRTGSITGYECSTIAIGVGGYTLWSVVDNLHRVCEIRLDHSQFETNDVVQVTECNSTATMLRVQATPVRNESECYTTQLTIIPAPGPFFYLYEGSIQCRLGIGFDEYIIGTVVLRISSDGNLSPPTDLRLIEAESGELTFNWTAPLQNCPSLEYSIYSSGDCICPSTSGSNNTLTCIGTQCIIRVYSVVCTGGRDAESTSSNVLSVNLTAPSIILCVPRYTEDRRLIRLETTFNTIEPFITSDGLEDTILSYTVTYSDSTSDIICGSATIQPSSCGEPVCRDTFDITSSSRCPPDADLNLTVSVTSTYGKARLNQHPIERDGVNNYVNVTFDHVTETITCVFLTEPLDSMKECDVILSYGAKCNTLIDIYEVSGRGDTLETPPLGFIEGIDQYCYEIIARHQNLNLNVTVEGIINLQRSSGTQQNGLDTGSMIAIIVSVIATAIVALVVGTTVLVRMVMATKQRRIALITEKTLQLSKLEVNPSTQKSESDVNTIIIGDLKIHKDNQIGNGMFGCVFQGEMQNRLCAVKVLVEIGREFALNVPITSQGGTIQEARLQSFERECQYLLNLRHSNIVELIDVYYFPQTKAPCLIMELLDCSLRSYLNSISHGLSRRSQISISCDVANGLAYLHENKVIHRDLCSDNILIREEDIPVAKITDFGMSRIFDMETMTHSISVLGHRNGYLPPEGPSNNYDLSLDIYMFGVIMVQIIHAIPDIRSPEERYRLIDEVPETHPMKQVINSCVMTEKEGRPKAEKVGNDLQILLQNSAEGHCNID